MPNGPSGRQQSWRAIAAMLAHRLSDAYCEQHRTPQPDCPHCEDVKAWEVWAAKAQATRRVLPGVPTPFHKLPYNETAVFRGRSALSEPPPPCLACGAPSVIGGWCGEHHP